jgi:enoyl-CoA hydratase
MTHLTLTVTDGVATILFDNPPLQVMTPQSMNELNAMLPRLREDDIRAVVFGGNPASGYFIRHFSVEELDDNARGTVATWDRSMDAVLYDLEHLPKVVISAMNGTALGGGLEFALATDIRVAKDGPYRFGLPEISIGILPGGGGTQRLPAIVGRGRALNMMLRPKLLTPREAYEERIIDELVPVDSRETALDRAQDIALEIAARSPHATARIKRLVRSSGSPVTMDQLGEESRLFGELLQTEEARTGLSRAAADHRTARNSEP